MNTSQTLCIKRNNVKEYINCYSRLSFNSENPEVKKARRNLCTIRSSLQYKFYFVQLV